MPHAWIKWLREVEPECMPAVADARGLEIEAVLPGKHLRDYHTVVHYLESHGNIGMRLRLRPARDDLAIGNFQITA